ncbi:hypothetical protein BHM03_00010792 [Ensete ventricosum]|nr:hypothetical protein BHM03_00010792 [Ensete ventricosum]
MFRLLLHRAAHNWKLLKELEKAAKVYWNAKDRLPPRVRWCTKCCLAGVPNCHVLTEYVPYYVFWRVSIERHLASVLRTSPPYPTPYPSSTALDPRVSQ